MSDTVKFDCPLSDYSVVRRSQQHSLFPWNRCTLVVSVAFYTSLHYQTSHAHAPCWFPAHRLIHGTMRGCSNMR